jgi:hypothetical protein
MFMEFCLETPGVVAIWKPESSLERVQWWWILMESVFDVGRC